MTDEEKNAKLEQKAKEQLAKGEREQKAEGRVNIRLPRLPEDRDQVVECGLNGRMYRIRRGETVSVPESVAAMLQDCGYI